MKKNLLHVVFGTTMVIGALSLTALNVAKVEATNGNTTLTGTACNDTVAVAVYDIDFGAFAATDVLGTIKINAGTKSGTQRTPSNGSADYYVYVTNTCHTDNGWNVTIRATTMTGTVAGSSIANTAQYFSGASTNFLFNGTVANSDITVGSFTTTTDLSTNRTILTRGTAANGLAGYYGRLFTHTVQLGTGQAVGAYTGLFIADCNSC